MGVGTKIRGLIDYYFKKKNEKNIISIDIPKNKEELLKGKIAFIVGGTGEIGMAIAEEFILAGAKVVISGTNSKKIHNAIKRLGNILVNAAGIHGNQCFGEITETTWDSVFDVNLKGLFFMTQAVGNYMKKNNVKGHILNVSSAASLKPGYTPYEISKNGVKAVTLGVAAELIPYGIVVNAIGPGPVATKMLGRNKEDTLYTDCVPAMRFATPSEVAQLAVIMVSDMCNLVIGDTFYISGGSGTIKYR